MVKNVFSDFPGALADTNCPLGASVKKKPFSSLPKKVLRDKIAFQPKEGGPPQMSRWRSVDKKREKKSARHSALFLQQLIVSTNSSFRGNLAAHAGGKIGVQISNKSSPGQSDQDNLGQFGTIRPRLKSFG